VKIKSLSDIKAIQAYLQRVGAEPRSLSAAVVKEQHGKYWQDVATIKFTKKGEVHCNDLQYAPTELEAASIAAECANVTWPQMKPIERIINPPAMIKNASRKDIFEFRDEQGQIIFVQVRIEADGGKSYVPWTYFDDDEWRCCEPEGQLPLYGLDRIGDNTTVFIHEGAKAAQRVQWMVDGETREAKDALKSHPWGQQLTGAAHLGWVGGALSPYRTDWSALRKAGVKRAYIIADNDEPGRAAVPAIAHHLRMPTFMIQFTDEFPVSFDLADPFPDEMFKENDATKFYTGPAFRECLHPATWATDQIPNPEGKGRPITVLRDCFKGLWAYIEETDTFVCTEMPDIMRTEQILNKMLAPFSHVAETSRLILKAYQGRSTRVCYRPDHEGLVVTFRGSSAINLHIPCQIPSVAGDIKPFLDFMRYLFVHESEMLEALRWVATLIARPDLRMGYGLLLISEAQGVGKTTLGSSILAPLVGVQNVSYPSENDINADFNGWVAHKRLAVVNEIYSGSSWKAYNALKSVITDTEVTVNQKYMRQYEIENWCHVVACSNSMRALKMENDDRRWFYPEVTEVPWPKEKFVAFRKWLNGGGLSIIKAWAEGFESAGASYVTPSERAPMTERKLEMIEGSRSESQAEAAAIADTLKELDKPAAVLIKDVVGWCREHVQGRVFDTDYELRRSMTDAGVHAWQKRIKVGGRLQYAIVNPKLLDLLQRAEAEEQTRLIRENVVKVSDIMQQEM
jgi:hypothetical protein